MSKPDSDFELSRAGWDLYHNPKRYPRANYPIAKAERITKEQYLAEATAADSPRAQGDRQMRGLNRLANLAQTIMEDIDKEANAVADELVAAKQSARETIGHFRDHAGTIRKVADDVKAQLGQISNMPPTPGSEG